MDDIGKTGVHHAAAAFGAVRVECAVQQLDRARADVQAAPLLGARVAAEHRVSDGGRATDVQAAAVLGRIVVQTAAGYGEQAQIKNAAAIAGGGGGRLVGGNLAVADRHLRASQDGHTAAAFKGHDD